MDIETAAASTERADGEPSRRPIQAPAAPRPTSAGLVIGTLIAIADEGRVPLVLYPGQPDTRAVAAASIVDLHGIHIGRKVALMFDDANPGQPLIMGVLRDPGCSPLDQPPGQVEVDADGERMIVSAREQLVLRCGKASITLTKTGKVLIQGEYVQSRSSGVNRIRGGSVHIN